MRRRAPASILGNTVTGVIALPYLNRSAVADIGLRLSAEQLPAALARGLAGIYLVSGDEPLLVGEAADAIRAAARAAGYADRTVFFIDRSFSWDELRLASQSLSLFAERRLFELRMPSGKPDKGAALLAELAAQPAPDLICLVITDKLDKKASDARLGAGRSKSTVPGCRSCRWRRRRCRAGCARGQKCCKVEIDPEAAQLIVDRVEGNLLAAQAGTRETWSAGERRADRRRLGAAVGRRQRALRCVPTRRGGRRRRCGARVAGAAGTEERGSGTDADSVGAGAGIARHVAGA